MGRTDIQKFRIRVLNGQIFFLNEKVISYTEICAIY
jgi:hypothetical protein